MWNFPDRRSRSLGLLAYDAKKLFCKTLMNIANVMAAPSLHSRSSSRTFLVITGRVLLFFIVAIVLLRSLYPKLPDQFQNKALVLASNQATSQNAAWLSQVPLDWSIYYYVTDGSAGSALSVPANKGNEAMVYLTYIIDHYETLPEVVFFRHDHYESWHQSFDSIFEISNLRTEYVLEKGYVSSRCLSGCENIMPVSGDEVDIGDIHLVDRDVQLRTLLATFLNGTKEIPEKIAAPCCAQFAASSDAIRSRSLAWWMSLRQWLIDTSLSSYHSGRLLEWTWHIWLGEEAR